MNYKNFHDASKCFIAKKMTDYKTLAFKESMLTINRHLKRQPDTEKSSFDSFKHYLPNTVDEQIALKFIDAKNLTKLQQTEAVKQELKRRNDQFTQETINSFQKHTGQTHSLNSIAQEVNERNHLIQLNAFHDYDKNRVMGNAIFYGLKIGNCKETLCYDKNEQKIAEDSFKNNFQLESIEPHTSFELSHQFDALNENLKKVKHLTIADQPAFQSFTDDAIENMNALKSFKVENCSLKAIPQSFGHSMNNLEEFSVHGNGLVELPDNIFEGSQHTLKHIDLGGNKLKHLPSSLSQCYNVEYLDVSNNKVANLSDMKFHNLKYLDISKTNEHGVLDLGLYKQQFPVLQHLVAYKTKFHSLKGTHPSLQSLNIEKSDINIINQHTLSSLMKSSITNLNLKSKGYEINHDEFLNVINYSSAARKTKLKQLAINIQPPPSDHSNILESLPSLNHLDCKACENMDNSDSE